MFIKYEMKDYILRVTFVLTLLAIGFQIVAAQEKRLDSSPKDFRTFFAKFKKAVEKNDKASVASMTKFPFGYGFDAGDEGKMTKAQFIKRFAEIFGENPKEFLTESNPMFSISEDGKYIISTEDAAHLSFIKQRSGFKFVMYIVEP